MPFPESVTRDVKRRAHFQCCLCRTLGVEIHHIVPQSEKGPDTLDNAAPLCPSCHETYGANPLKRKFIREARDLWYEICEKRYAPDPTLLCEVRDAVSRAASKSDISELRQDILSSLGKFALPSGVLSVSVPRTPGGDETGRDLTIADFLVMIFGLSSERPREQLDLLTHKALWPVKGGYRTAYNAFLKKFGNVTLRHLAARGLDQAEVPIEEGLTEEEVVSALSLLSVEAVCLIELSNGRFRAVLREDGEVEWSLEDRNKGK